jgi:hypothetical protein
MSLEWDYSKLDISVELEFEKKIYDSITAKKSKFKFETFQVSNNKYIYNLNFRSNIYYT